jgi:hypothetical protein
MKPPAKHVPLHKIWGWIIIAVLMVILGWTVVRLISAPPLSLTPGQVFKARWVVAPGLHHVGDPVPVSLEIESAHGIRVSPPDLSRTAPGVLEFTEKKSTSTEWFFRGKRTHFRFQIVSWEVGRFPLPGVTLRYAKSGSAQRTVAVKPAMIAITSVLPVGKTESELLALPPKGMKGPLGLKPRYEVLGWLAALLAAIGLIYGAARWWRASRHNPSERVAVQSAKEPAHIIALRRLSLLETAGFLKNGDYEGFYVELSETAREYIENRFEIRALEMTTEEFLNRAASDRCLESGQQSLLQQFLNSSDLVKFARYTPDPGQPPRDLTTVRQFIEATKSPEPDLSETLPSGETDRLKSSSGA